MKLSIPRSELHRVLATASRAAARSPHFPILSSVLLTAEDDRLRIVASDLDTTVITWCDASVRQVGNAAAPAHLLESLIGSLSGETVELSQGENKRLSVTCERHSSTLAGHDPDEYPALPTMPEATIRVKASDLAEGLGSVVHAAAQDDYRPALRGILLAPLESGLRLVTADGYRLSVATVPAERLGEAPDAILPAALVKLAIALLGKREEMIDVGLAPNRVGIAIPDLQLFGQLIDATFPKWQQIVPTEHETRVSIDSAALRDAVRTLAPFARADGQGFRLLILDVSGDDLGEIVLSARNDDGEGRQVVSCAVQGPAIRFGLASRMMADVLAVLKGAIHLDLSTPSRPLLARPAVGDEARIELVMPMNLGAGV